MLRRPDNQEVGLEAAILERVRNSSLVEWCCADNVSGLKPPTEAVDSGSVCGRGLGGRGASPRRGEVVLEGAVERGGVRMPA